MPRFCIGIDTPKPLIVVVDNGSQDGSVNFVQENYPKVQIIALPENLGYAGAVNYGIEWALKQSANFVFILNNDTIVSPQAISQVVEVMIKNQQQLA
jgi:GT2 family glycosyltransferase